jgi:hypothetical protein
MNFTFIYIYFISFFDEAIFDEAIDLRFLLQSVSSALH